MSRRKTAKEQQEQRWMKRMIKMLNRTRDRRKRRKDETFYSDGHVVVRIADQAGRRRLERFLAQNGLQ